MNLQNTPWDYQEHDRIISILAWVVVVVLVIYASVFFYKEITSSSQRPVTVAGPLDGPEIESLDSPGGDEKLPELPSEDGPDLAAPPVPSPPPTATGPRPVAVTRTPPPAQPVFPAGAAAGPATGSGATAAAVMPAGTGAPSVSQPPPAPPREERMTLKVGKFGSAGEAVREGVGLGIDGYRFMPVRDPLTNRYTLHFGEFTAWRDAVAVMERIKARNGALEVVVWPLPSAPAARRPESEPTPAARPPEPPERRPEPTPPPPPVVQRPAPPPPPVAQRPAVAPANTGRQGGLEGPYVVRVASYSQEGNARGMVDRLRKAGFPASLDSTVVRGRKWFRVHVGGFGSADEARRASGAIRQVGRLPEEGVVVRL